MESSVCAATKRHLPMTENDIHTKKQKPAIKNDMYLFIIGKIAYATVDYNIACVNSER